MKHDFVEGVLNCFKTEGVDLRVNPTVMEHRAFVRDVASRREEVSGKTDDADDDWDFGGMVSADEIAKYGVRGKIKEIQRICEDRSKAVPTFVVEVIDLSPEIVERKLNTAKLMDRITDLVIKLDGSRAAKRLACDRIQKSEAQVKTLEDHVEVSDARYSKTVADAAQVQKVLRTRVTSLESAIKAEKDRIAIFEEDRVDKNVADRDVFIERQKAHDALKDQLKKKEKTMRQIRAEPSVATSELEKLHLRAKKAEGELSIARADVLLQTMMWKEAQEQLDLKVAKLKEVQLRLKMREDELFTLYDA